jgi:hypothetical protein
MTAEAIAAHLSARPVSAVQWMARCPGHDDGSPSLSIKETGGRILIYCRAGCPTATVLKAAGLTFRDLFAGPPPTPAQLARVAAERQERDARKQAERVAARKIVDRLRKLDALAFELATRLDVAPYRPDGDALAGLFHACVEQIRDGELALAGLSG